MYTRVSTPPTSRHPYHHLYSHHFHPSATASTKDRTMRTNPSDILFAALSLALLLLTAFTLGGLAAHPFAG